MESITLSEDVGKQDGSKIQAIDFVILAEFDIDTGSTIRHQYPREVPGYTADYFANYMLPEGAHKRTEDMTFIFLNRDGEHIAGRQWIHPDVNTPRKADTPAALSAPFLYGLNVVKTEFDSSVRRGAVVKAIAVFSRYSFVHIFQPALESALALYFAGASDTLSADLFKALNALDLASVPCSNVLDRALMKYWRGAVEAEPNPIRQTTPDHVRTLVLSFNGYQHALRLPLMRSPDEVGAAGVLPLLKAFGLDTMRIYNAVLTGKRVCFVGYSHSAKELAALVLGTVALVAPPIAGVIKRAFPYASLTDLTFLECGGFIAGCTNPIFSGHPEWWDLLCVLDGDYDNEVGTIPAAGAAANNNPRDSASLRPGTIGRVLTSEQVRRDKERNGGRPAVDVGGGARENVTGGTLTSAGQALLPCDLKFVSHVIAGMESAHVQLGEEWVSQRFHDYTWDILQRGLDRKALDNGGSKMDVVRDDAAGTAAGS